MVKLLYKEIILDNLNSGHLVDLCGFVMCASSTVTSFTYFEHPDFSECYPPNERIILTLKELLDGYDLSRVSMATLEHNTIGPLTYLANALIFLHFYTQDFPGRHTVIEIDSNTTNSCFVPTTYCLGLLAHRVSSVRTHTLLVKCLRC